MYKSVQKGLKGECQLTIVRFARECACKLLPTCAFHLLSLSFRLQQKAKVQHCNDSDDNNSHSNSMQQTQLFTNPDCNILMACCCNVLMQSYLQIPFTSYTYNLIRRIYMIQSMRGVCKIM